MRAPSIQSSGVDATIVCVTGAPRSGTSLTMRVLNLLGVYLGPASALKPAGPANPSGFWEHEEINALNVRILRALGGSRRKPPVPERGWAASALVSAERDAGKKIVADVSAGRDLWGWKDTSNALALPLWQQLVPGEIRYVLCIRNPLDVAASLEHRAGLGITEALALSTTYGAALLAHTAGRPRLLVAYEEWFGDWRAPANRLARFLGVPAPTPDSEVGRSIERLVDRNLCHHSSTDVEAVADDRLSGEAASIHLLLRLLHATELDGQRGPQAATVPAAVDAYAERLLARAGNERAAEIQSTR